MAIQVRINHQIKSPELRVVGENGENYGLMTLSDALKKADESNLDLIEISPNAMPPVAKIMDYGKFQYDANKKQKLAKTRASTVEIKNVQVKVGTGDHDLDLKAKKVSEWLKEGHRVKIDLFLPGRTKYMDFNFLKERLGRILKLVSEEYRVADEPKKSMKGITTIIERASKKI